MLSKDQEFAKKLFPQDALDLAIDWISKRLNPEDVFSEKDLTKWALENGFVKEEEASE